MTEIPLIEGSQTFIVCGLLIEYCSKRLVKTKKWLLVTPCKCLMALLRTPAIDDSKGKGLNKQISQF